MVRGGYGIFYTSYEGREIDDSADIYPYSIRNNLQPHYGQNSLDPKLSNGLFPAYSTLGPFPSRRCRSSPSSSRRTRSILTSSRGRCQWSASWQGTPPWK